MVIEKTLDSPALIPCVTYECACDFVVTAVSSNSFELIGICPENMIGHKEFWEERVLPGEREQLITGLSRAKSPEVTSMLHRLINDRGLPVLVAHGVHKTNSRGKERLHGCLIPLSRESCLTEVRDSTISHFIHKLGNHFQLINLLIGSLNETESNREDIEALRSSVDRAVEFTNAFSNYAQQPELGSMVNLGELLYFVVSSFEPFVHDKKVLLQTEIEETLNDVVMPADAYLLEVAFTAVLQNALDATGQGGKIVVRGKEPSQHTGEKLARIAIIDTGTGMEKEMLAKATNPFVTSKRDRDGLGLSTATRMIEIHGGQLTISSTVGKGTEVEILLPVEFSAESSAA